MLPKLFFSVVVPAQSFLSQDSSNEDDFIVVIVIIILEVSEIAIHSCNPMAVELFLVCWVSLKLVGKFDFLLLA